MTEMLSVVYPKGFKVGTGRGGLKTHGDDVMLLLAEKPCAVAAVFTTNKMCAAPVKYSRRVVKGGTARAIVANAGNANAATGRQGLTDARRTCALAAKALDCDRGEVFVASTGVIGRPLDMGKVSAGVSDAAGKMGDTAAHAAAAAAAILTTDTRPKASQAEVEIGGTAVRIGGITKGAGMISPKMATMLAFLTTDAAITAPVLQGALSRAVETTFNRVTIDGDMSTNDTVFLLASGLSGAPQIDEGTAELEAFRACLEKVCLELAKAIAADGEGATKFVEVRVSGATSEKAAVAQARAIANSPLVKTALFGCDPNWGRVLAAAGYAGAPFKEEKAVLKFNGVAAFEKGVPQPKSDSLSAAVKPRDIVIELDLGLGDGTAVIYTCDYSYDYIKVNAEYHT